MTYPSGTTDPTCYFSQDTEKNGVSVFPIYDESTANLLDSCSGSVKFGTSVDANMKVNVYYGSIFVNYIASDEKLPDDNDDLYIASSYKYDDDMIANLNQDMLTKAKEIKNKTSVSAEPIWIVDIGNKYL